MLTTLFLLSLASVTALAHGDASLVLADYPLYKTLQSDKVFSQRFFKYMEFASTGSPDGKRVFQLMQSGAKSLEALSTIFHEQVEFLGWLDLKHRFEDIINARYYRDHYDAVYPIAHRRAVIEELSLIRFFARKKGLPLLPEVAFNLTSPLIELCDVPVVKMQNRLKYSHEYLAQVRFLDARSLERAIAVYEAGGYRYKDRTRILSEAAELIKRSLMP